MAQITVTTDPEFRGHSSFGDTSSGDTILISRTRVPEFGVTVKRSYSDPH